MLTNEDTSSESESIDPDAIDDIDDEWIFQDSFEEYSDEDEYSPAYGALPIYPTRRSPSPSAVPLRSCLKKVVPPVIEEIEQDRVYDLADEVEHQDEGEEDEAEHEDLAIEIEEYMMAGLLGDQQVTPKVTSTSEAPGGNTIITEQPSSNPAPDDWHNEHDWQWSTYAFLKPGCGSRQPLATLFPISEHNHQPQCPAILTLVQCPCESPSPDNQLTQYPIYNPDGLAELGGLFRNALFDHGRGRRRTRVASRIKHLPIERHVMIKADGSMTPPSDNDTNCVTPPQQGEEGIFLRWSTSSLDALLLQEEIPSSLDTLADGHKRVRFPMCPERMGEVALCSLYPTWSPSEYDRTPLEPPSEEEKACKMPERGSRCLSEQDSHMSSLEDVYFSNDPELDRLDTIFEGDDHDIAFVTGVPSPSVHIATSNSSSGSGSGSGRGGWSSWCTDSYGSSGGADEFGLERQTNHDDSQVYGSWQDLSRMSLAPFAQSSEARDYACSFSNPNKTNPTKTNAGGDHYPTEDVQDEDEEEEDDDCWEAWLDERKRAKALKPPSTSVIAH